uniref:Small ribosomal subunit protein uS3c n=1 Tax=Phaeophyceae sp. TaxID=2249243 RepID=A0A8E5BDG2_9PHAE|nr:ribosomal protein S3 [Phaeophyceae sp.]
MGQKTHPLGFRVGILKEDRSLWCSKKKSYIEFLKADYKIRAYIKEFWVLNKSSYSGDTEILIKRDENKKKVYIEIQAAFPKNLIGESGALLETLNKKLNLFFPSEKIMINMVEIENYYAEASILVDLLAQNLIDRVPFRKCIRTTLKRYKNAKKVKGIKVQIAGRLNGAEMARTEWVREGRVPLQTLRADIDYSSKPVHTPSGILGLKIWLFKEEILKKKTF